jgi:hypothetical protein
MLGKISESTCRLNFYVQRPDLSTQTYTADSWGFGTLAYKKCLVMKDNGTGKVIVLGRIVRREQVAAEDLDLTIRVRVVEEGLILSERHEWRFMLEIMDEADKQQILRGPLIEPARLVGENLYL